MPEPRQEEFLREFLAAQRVIRAYLQAATRDVNETDDLLQQVGRELWERFGEYESGRPFAAWAMGFARIQVMRWRQQRTRLQKMRPLSPEAMEAVAAAAEGFAVEPDTRPALLAACLERVEAKARQLLELRYAAGLSIRQVAEQLGRQVGAVEMALVRARRALKACVERKLKETEAGPAGP